MRTNVVLVGVLRVEYLSLLIFGGPRDYRSRRTSEGMESEPGRGGKEVTKDEIIEKTLREIGPHLEEHEEPNSEEPEGEEIVIAELQKRLPETNIKTCKDFRHLNVPCCDTCHTFYPHYEMSLINLPDGAKAWVCDPVKWAIYPEQYQTPRVEARLSRGQSA
jgi:hypothetical protein